MHDHDKEQISRFEEKWGAHLRNSGLKSFSPAEREAFDRDSAPLLERKNLLGKVAQNSLDGWATALSGSVKDRSYKMMSKEGQIGMQLAVRELRKESSEYTRALQRVFMEEPLPFYLKGEQVDRQLGLWNGTLKSDPDTLRQQGKPVDQGLDFPVKVVAKGKNPPHAAGYIVNARDIYGRTTWELEQMLGLKKDELLGGAEILRLGRVPAKSELFGEASTQYPGGKFDFEGPYLPAEFDFVGQCKLRKDVNIPVADRISLEPAEYFTPQASQLQKRIGENMNDEALKAHQEKTKEMFEAQTKRNMGRGSASPIVKEARQAPTKKADNGPQGIGPREKELGIGGR